MLITPRPGAHRRNIRDSLSSARNTVDNLRGPAQTNAYGRLLRYLEWTSETAGVLRSQISDTDIDRLIFTDRYRALMASVGTLAGSHQERLVNGLVSLELTERVQAFDEALEALQDRVGRWSGLEQFVVADSSFYIQNPQHLQAADLHQILGISPAQEIRILFPIAVVDELDSLKDAGKHRARYRARYTLWLLDNALAGQTFGCLHPEGPRVSVGTGRGAVNMEVVLDQPGHVRLPITDDEIIDRTVAIQALAAREVRLLTCDTGQHTRGRAAGLQVTKVPAKDPGVEPDWEAEEKTGPGTRAQRRARQAEMGAHPDQHP